MKIDDLIEKLEKRGFRVDTAYKTVYEYSSRHQAYLFYCKYNTMTDLQEI